MAKREAPSDSTPPTSKGRFVTFWTTLPGILTGFAALITAIVSVITVLHPFGGGSNASTTMIGRSSAPFTLPSETTTAVASPSATLTSSVPSGVLAQGTLAMKSGDYANLAQGRVGNSVLDPDLYLHGGPLWQLDAWGSLAPTSGQLDRAACVSALKTRSDGYEELSKFRAGSVFCLETGDDHVGMLRIVTLPGVGTGELVLDYTVWQ
jgi:hypothetical protein